jgi:5-methylcytosine-specific restriction endonuclease McrA
MLTMHRRTKALQISPDVKRRVWERDGRCILCHRPGSPDAHYIPRSQGGLGIEKNIVTLCQSCHMAYDQGFARRELGIEIRAYLMKCYPDWDEADLVYRKG